MHLFHKHKPQLEIEPFSDRDTLFKFLGELGAKIANEQLSERQAELSLACVTKFFSATTLYNSLKEPEKPPEICATKTELEAVKSDLSTLRKELQIKVKDGMFT